MRHTITIGKDGIAYAKIIGDGDANIAKEFVAAANAIFDKYPNKKISAIVDMLESGTSDYQGIKIYKDFLKNGQIGKIAFIIKNPVIMAFVKIATEFKKEYKVFDSMEKARDWINE